MTTIRFEVLTDSPAKFLHAIRESFPHLAPSPAPPVESTCNHPVLIEEYEGRIATLMERIESLESTNREQARMLQDVKMDDARKRADPTPVVTHTRTAGKVSGPISDLDEIPF